ncbi:bifunctional ADP-dependent NAD(P)H-hydrate dehydratase/NAD(P)H-hydrate epimerase [Granulicoccus phenolivorans]|uniref:bifunctional ADP-dependent NAD(P)H-hydrate dehydratase/NAD(P)H-hydrate epimerase n=1 Tax=Granulicoccus phenolivorans TaxID=266854 RepID=UPI0004186313|nr:bifunctional ADP-dependent NAD(P)H-hydrate dehydratase/NAD(P)H-hydrate epimerase [Granulicoccus phenolivorans]
MKYAYTAAQIRAAEAAEMARLAHRALMQRAAIGLAEFLVRRLHDRHGFTQGGQLLLIVGPGFNGGDALFAGVRLLKRGIQVLAWRFTDRVYEAGWEAFIAAGGREVGDTEAWTAAQRVDIVVDGGFGIGGRPGLTGKLADFAPVLERANDVVAVDLPSGLDADAAQHVQPCLRADATVTFGAYKICQLTDPVDGLCGDVELISIGLSLSSRDAAVAALDRTDLQHVWPQPGPHSDKYSRGVVGIDTGSDDYPGAAVLSTLGAVYSGAGMVRFLGAPRALDLVLHRLPNVVAAAGRVQAYLFGSGWGQRPDGRPVIESALATGVPAVIDADGLNHLPAELSGCLLTPHAGELARLLRTTRAEVEADPIGHVRRAATDLGVTVLLKGAVQYVAAPGTECVRIAIPGPAWTAQAGSGDTLAGVAATLLAGGLTPIEAALGAASLQALTAAAHPGPHPPQDLALQFPAMIAELTGGPHRAR